MMQSKWMTLKDEFFFQTNTLEIAQQLLGKILVTRFNNQLTAVRIVETEAYLGTIDKASHAWNNRYTARTSVMYKRGGIAYVYLCYGIHHLTNVVVQKENVPHAILLRAGEPLMGIDIMQKRRKIKKVNQLAAGPGNLSKALGIHLGHNGQPLQSKNFYLVDDGCVYPNSSILATPRIGVDYAGEDALLPYRFIVKGNECVSGPKI